MVVAVEIFRRDEIGHAIEGLIVEQKRAEQGLLRLHRVRRHLQRMELGIRAFLTRSDTAGGGILLCERHINTELQMRRMITRSATKNKGRSRGPCGLAVTKL
ncbi:MAG: hypothetical protein ACWGNS_08625 [Burkholderiales bacterium]